MTPGPSVMKAIGGGAWGVQKWKELNDVREISKLESSLKSETPKLESS